MSLPGILHVYDPPNRHVAFESGPSDSSKVFVFIGGLGDGLAAIPILPTLSDHLAKKNWSLVQFLTESSYSGYGTSSIDNDIRDINTLVSFLRDVLNKSTIVLMGHSTGCQDLVHFFKQRPSTIDSISGVILQAPVSDQEGMSDQIPSGIHERTFRECEEVLDSVKNLPPEEYPWPGSSKGPLVPFNSQKLPSAINDTIFSAQRYLSLQKPRGYEDFFSSYLTNDELYHHLHPLSNVPLLMLSGAQDQTVPDFVDKQKLLERFETAAAPQTPTKKSRALLLQQADHNLSIEQGQQNFLEAVLDFITSLQDYK